MSEKLEGAAAPKLNVVVLNVDHGNGERCRIQDGAESYLVIPQGLLRPLAVGDVPQERHNPTAFGGAVLNADFDFKNAPILAAVPALESSFAPRHDLLNVGRCIAGCFVGLQVGNRHGQQFWRAVAAHPAVGFIDFQQSPLGVRQPQAVHGRLEDGSVPLRTLPQRRLGALALGDVAGAHEQEHLSLPDKAPRGDIDGKNGSVFLAMKTQRDSEDPAWLFPRLLDAPARVLGFRRQLRARLGEQLIPVVTIEHRRHVIGFHDLARLGVDQEDRVG